MARAIDRARTGMKTLMRFGCGMQFLRDLIGTYTEAAVSARQLASARTCCLPETSQEGGLDVAVRRIIAAGVSPGRSDRHGDRRCRRSFPGRFRHGLDFAQDAFADMILLDDLASLSIRKVIFSSKLVAEDRAMQIDFPHLPDRISCSRNRTVTSHACRGRFRGWTARPDGRVKVRCVGVSDTLLATDDARSFFRPRAASSA